MEMELIHLESKDLSLDSQDKMPLAEALIRYSKEKVISFDVPGHKRGAQNNSLKGMLGSQALRLDVNSMKELDLLSHPESVIKEAQDLAAKAYGADAAYFLVNGTTVGILAMILTACKPNDTFIVPRNAHKSVMNGIILSGANPVFIQPEVDHHFGIAHGVSLESVKVTLEQHPNAKAIVITYPTYFGSMTQLKEICQLAHEKNVIVLVDSAHGAHLTFMDDYNEKAAIQAGADVVTVSMHKTGGSLTQSSLLLLTEKRIKREQLQKTLNMLQSTSASYLLMSSLDTSRRDLVLYGFGKFRDLKPIVKKAIKRIEANNNYEVLNGNYLRESYHQTFDWTKLVIRVNNIGLTGFEVYEILKKEYKIQVELAEGYCIMAVITTSDTYKSINSLVEALLDIENKFNKNRKLISKFVTTHEMNQLKISPREAYYAEHEVIPILESIGRISADSLMIYPPGIPLVIPGEIISSNVIEQYCFYQQTMGSVLTEAKRANYITVIKECLI